MSSDDLPTGPFRRSPALPLELLYIILDYVPSQAYGTITSTNKAINNFCNSRLYRHINLSRHWGRSLLLCRTLVQSPHLGDFVRTCDLAPLDLRAQPHTYNIYIPLLSQSNELYSLGTAKLKNAEALTLCSVPTDFGSRHPNVTRVHLKTMPSIGLRMVANLCDAITYLELPNIVPSESVPIGSGDIPHLEVLISPLNAAIQLVPGRQIHTLIVKLASSQDLVPHSFNDLVPLTTGKVGITRLGAWAGPSGSWQGEMTTFSHDLTIMRAADLLPVELLALDTSRAPLNCPIESLSTVAPFLSMVTFALLSTPKLRSLDLSSRDGRTDLQWGPLGDDSVLAVVDITARLVDLITMPDGVTWRKDCQSGQWHVDPQAKSCKIVEPWPKGVSFARDSGVLADGRDLAEIIGEICAQARKAAGHT